MNGPARKSPGRRARLRSRCGLSLIEVLISLSIAASLLTAVAAAFSASASAIEVNDEFFRATQAGRVSLGRLLAEARRGTVDENSTATSLRLIVETRNDAGDVIATADRTYQFIAAEKRLVMITNDGIDDAPYTLCSNVADVTFEVDPDTAPNGTQYVERVVISIAVKVGKHEVRLSGSAAPRKYLTY